MLLCDTLTAISSSNIVAAIPKFQSRTSLGNPQPLRISITSIITFLIHHGRSTAALTASVHNATLVRHNATPSLLEISRQTESITHLACNDFPLIRTRVSVLVALSPHLIEVMAGCFRFPIISTIIGIVITNLCILNYALELSLLAVAMVTAAGVDIFPLLKCCGDRALRVATAASDP